MDLKQLRHFLALVEYGTYAKASEAVCLSQSALTRSIQQLELQLGVQLFERGRFGANLTVFGKSALVYIKEMMNKEASLRQALDSLSELTSGELKIGAGPYPMFTLIDQIATSFVGRYPKIGLTIHTDNWSNLHKKLLANDIELFVADITELEQDPNLKILKLPQLAGVVVCRPNHPLVAVANVDWKDIFRYPIALPTLPQKLKDNFRSLSEQLGCNFTQIQCESIPLLLSVVSGSDAITLIPEKLLLKKSLNYQLIKLNVSNIPDELRTNYGVVKIVNHQPSPAGQAFFEMVHSSIY